MYFRRKCWKEVEIHLFFNRELIKILLKIHLRLKKSKEIYLWEVFILSRCQRPLTLLSTDNFNLLRNFLYNLFSIYVLLFVIEFNYLSW